jgi:hypothetical protein
MKIFTTALAAAAIAAFAVLPAQASPVCIESHLIDHTSVQDSKTVLFHMKDGKVWRNTLQNPCPSLNFHGFVMNMGPVDTVCSNQQSISVLKTHETCMLGEFAPYAAPAAAPGDKS